MSGLLLIGGMVLLSPLRFAAVREAGMKSQLDCCSGQKVTAQVHSKLRPLIALGQDILVLHETSEPANHMVPTLFPSCFSMYVGTYFIIFLPRAKSL